MIFFPVESRIQQISQQANCRLEFSSDTKTTLFSKPIIFRIRNQCQLIFGLIRVLWIEVFVSNLIIAMILHSNSWINMNIIYINGYIYLVCCANFFPLLLACYSIIMCLRFFPFKTSSLFLSLSLSLSPWIIYHSLSLHWVYIREAKKNG